MYLGTLIYQIGIQLLAWLMPVAGLFSPKIRLGVQGRKGLKKRLQEFKDELPIATPIAWFHAASLGEFEQGRPVMEAFRAQYPHYRIVLTFFSPSGYEIRKSYAVADFICYLPIDTPANSRWFVGILKPQIAFFIKYEFWYNILQNLKESGAVILSFSTIFRPDQLFFKPYGGFYRNMLHKFDYLFVQNKASMKLLGSINIESYGLAGDTRFDRVFSIAQQAKTLDEIEPFVTELPVLIAGSVWPQDMQILIPMLNKTRGRLKAIIAPHEIKKDQIRSWCSDLKGSSVLYSELAGTDLRKTDYLMIDNIGMLSSLYQYGKIGYIGGAFGVGLHNTLEAATFGLPLVFGNKVYQRFQEAVAMVDIGGAVPVADVETLILVIEKWLTMEDQRRKASELNTAYVSENIGATQSIMSRVVELLP